jgi:hypothetical protein
VSPILLSPLHSTIPHFHLLSHLVWQRSLPLPLPPPPLLPLPPLPPLLPLLC